MGQVLMAVGIVGAIGLAAGVVLAVAAAVMHVPTDERTEQALAILPGANCGACGCSGCRAYAEAVALAGAPCNLCVPGGQAAGDALAALMGTEAVPVAERKALVRCGGTHEACKHSYEYRGDPTCAAASLLYSGQKQCNYGCLGFGDCARACPHGAIALVGGVAVVDQERCIGCALCMRECPKGIIVMRETKGRAVNRCCSHAQGAVVRRQCTAGCIGCRLCEKACPAHAIAVTNNLARVDPDKCTGCGACISTCPTKSLTMA